MVGPTLPEFLELQQVVAGRYLVEREIGRGGMGVVFLARDVALERPVAIKLLPRHLCGNPALRERFLREARTAAQLMHPNIVPIHLVESHDECVFFVMALVDGETLAERVSRAGVLPVAEVVRVMQEVAWALGYAHGRGVVHRDIKPENVLLERATGRALVADFGIARVASVKTLSPEGATFGTPAYMSPEQAAGDAVDGRSDLYSLGATTYFALTGASPVEAPSLPAMLTRLLTDPAVPLSVSRPELPPPLSEAVMRCLAKRIDDRFESADALGVALQDAAPIERAVLPEVRSFVREFSVAQVLPPFGGALALLGGAAYKIGVMDARSAGVMAIIGASVASLFPVAVYDGLSALRRRGVAVEELDRGLGLESGYTSAGLAIKAGEMSRSIRRFYRVMGSVLVVGGIAAAAIVHDPSFPWTKPVTFLTLGVAGLGVLFVWKTLGDHPLPRWMHNPEHGLKRADQIERWPLEVLRKVIRTPLIRRFLERGVRATQLRVAEGLPTATMLLNRVGDLLEHIPADVVGRLGPVREVAQSLERAIARLRQRGTRLAAAAAELTRGSVEQTEFLDALAAVQRRIIDGTTELGNLRTNLLRLGAGLIAAEGITAELERAQELSAAIDAELHGQDEVRRLGV